MRVTFSNLPTMGKGSWICNTNHDGYNNLVKEGIPFNVCKVEIDY
jgi:hypothetical protein